MTLHSTSLLPYYCAGALDETRRRQVEQHLQACPACRQELARWQAVATAVEAGAEPMSAALPPLSPILQANLTRKPGLRQSVSSTAELIWAQRMVLMRGGVLPGVALALICSLFAGLLLQIEGSAAVGLPLLGLSPILAALAAAYLHHPDSDPAWQMITAAPTHPAVLASARLTLALAALGGLGMIFSLALAFFTPGHPISLALAWLPPMLWLSALATLLSVAFGPVTAAAVSLTLWGGVIAWLAAELQGWMQPAFSLLFFLRPISIAGGVQLLMAGLLWACAWLVQQNRSNQLLRMR